MNSPASERAPRQGFAGVCVVAAAVLGGVLAAAPLGFGEDEYKGQAPAQRCLGLVAVVVVLWSTEAIAPFLTALLIPLIAVPARVLCVPRHLREISESDTLLVPASYCNATEPAPGTPMDAEQAVVVATGAFFDPVILLFLSGFVMSEVLLKYGISERCAAALLSRAGTGPRRVLVATMVACMSTSGVMSNVPAAVLGTSLLKPTYHRAACRTSWPVMSLLGVAFSCNIGGMTSPIASPQNVIAMIALERATGGESTLSFFSWMAVSVPFCIVTTAVIFGFLVILHGTGLPEAIAGPWSPVAATTAKSEDEISLVLINSRDTMETEDRSQLSTPIADEAHGPTSVSYDGDTSRLLSSDADIDSGAATALHTSREGISTEDVFIILVVVITMLLWVFFRYLKPYFGSIGIIALLPIIVFGGFRYLSVVEFNRLSWDVLILMGGGLSLGTIVDSSGLLLVVGDAMGQFLQGQSLFVVLLAFSSLVAVLANFISSTVAAVLLLPVVAEVGVAVGHPRMLVLLCAFMTSGAMGLPVSSFPNANSFAQRDSFGGRILTNLHYVKAGFPVCALVLVLINSLGFGLCYALGY
mmetsp:Transcript_25891/g.67948  ORF Transcript_25891/g.67948 Transcript_25891/m.67948 type:complete len:585 (+) Transcript_25891:426-2180(+)